MNNIKKILTTCKLYQKPKNSFPLRKYSNRPNNEIVAIGSIFGFIVGGGSFVAFMNNKDICHIRDGSNILVEMTLGGTIGIIITSLILISV
jgi:hypothetical protein